MLMIFQIAGGIILATFILWLWQKVLDVAQKAKLQDIWSGIVIWVLPAAVIITIIALPIYGIIRLAIWSLSQPRFFAPESWEEMRMTGESLAQFLDACEPLYFGVFGASAFFTCSCIGYGLFRSTTKSKASDTEKV